MVPQHEVEILPRQLLLVLEARLPEHGLHHLGQLGLGQAVVGDLNEGPGARGREPSGPEKGPGAQAFRANLEERPRLAKSQLPPHSPSTPHPQLYQSLLIWVRRRRPPLFTLLLPLSRPTSSPGRQSLLCPTLLAVPQDQPQHPDELVLGNETIPIEVVHAEHKARLLLRGTWEKEDPMRAPAHLPKPPAG